MKRSHKNPALAAAVVDSVAAVAAAVVADSVAVEAVAAAVGATVIVVGKTSANKLAYMTADSYGSNK
jgi:hypothetical protein